MIEQEKTEITEKDNGGDVLALCSNSIIFPSDSDKVLAPSEVEVNTSKPWQRPQSAC
jgi:hypothetical protein